MSEKPPNFEEEPKEEKIATPEKVVELKEAADVYHTELLDELANLTSQLETDQDESSRRETEGLIEFIKAQLEEYGASFGE